MRIDQHGQAEKFIEGVIAPVRAAEAERRQDYRARAALAAKERDLVKRELAGSGFDSARLDKFAATQAAERKKLADEDRRRATKLSAAAGRRLADLGQWVFPADPMETVIDEVTFIRSFADQGSVSDSNIAPGDNWARYRVRGDGDDFWDGTGRLSFFTLWQNPLDADVFVTPRASLSVNARLSCDADWSGVADWFGLGSEARATVNARTTVWGMNSSQRSVVDDRQLGSVSVSGGFFGDDSSQSIEYADVLQGSGVVVLPRAFMLFEIELVTDWHANGGASVTLDADSGSHRVGLSQLVLGGVSPQQPPTPTNITLSATINPFAGGAIVTLSWSGASGSRVDIFRDGVKVADTANTGSFSQTLGTGSYQFRVCETASTRCSSDVTVTVP